LSFKRICVLIIGVYEEYIIYTTCRYREREYNRRHIGDTHNNKRTASNVESTWLRWLPTASALLRRRQI